MPTYFFRCDACDLGQEVFKPLAEYNNPTLCSKCSQPMHQVFSAVPFHLKGNCWAKDNYSRDHVTFRMKDGSKQTVPVKDSSIINKGKN